MTVAASGRAHDVTPVGILGALFVLSYPAAVYFGLTRLSARPLGVGLAMLMGVGLLLRLQGTQRAHAFVIARIPLTLISLLVLGALFNDGRFVLALPILANLALLAHFATSLWTTPIAERVARTRDDDLSPDRVAYCRRVTIAWCVFFVCNGATTALLALLAPLAWWSVYTGLISYVLIGLLVAAEYVARKARFRRYDGTPVDRLLARVFPPLSTAASRGVK